MRDWNCNYQYRNFEAFHAITQRYIPKPTYHGTPIAPDQLRGHEILPAQSIRRPSGGDPIEHGPRAVCTSKLPEPFPSIRALFHDQQPAFNNTPPDFYLARAANRHNESYVFVGALALRQLADSQATGYVYGCDGRWSKPCLDRADLAEYRTLHAIVWHTCAAVGVADLPHDLRVIDESSDKSWEFIKEYKAGVISPEQTARQMGGVAIVACDDYLKSL